MKVSVLSSSSQGNCIYLEHNNKKYLFDCGISYRKLIEKMTAIGSFLDKLDGIFITHEHFDHISGLSSVIKKFNTNIYMTKGTYNGLSEKDKEKISPIYINFVKKDKVFKVDDITIYPFGLSHDAIDPVGYMLTFGDKKLVYLTDTGSFEAVDLLKNADFYILESNHEPDMLMLSNRPWSLINRILSAKGHLSNYQSVELFSKLIGDNTKKLVLYHLSNECNTKELALLAFKNYFKARKINTDNLEIYVSDREMPIKLLEV